MQNNFPIKPVGNKLIAIPLPKKESTVGSIVVAESVNAELSQAKIVSVSEQISNVYKVGDVVLYPSRKGIAQIIEGKQYIWLDADVFKEEIWGIDELAVSHETKDY